MNHLDAEICSKCGDSCTAEIPHADRIRLSFGPGYDFSQLPADFLVVPREDRKRLTGNCSLSLVRENNALALFRIRK